MIQVQASKQQIQHTIIERLFLELFKRLSVCLIVFGRRGSGKTDFALYVTEILAKYKKIDYFATNVKIYESPFEIMHIDNLEDLEDWASANAGRKLFLLDEAGKTLRRRTPMSRVNVQWLDNLQILRKYKLSLILVVPAEKYIDSSALGSDVLDAVVVKPNFKNPKIALYEDKLEGSSARLWNVPATSIRFDTWDVAVFKKSSLLGRRKFSDKDMQNAWDLTHGLSSKELGLHPMQVSRLLRKMTRAYLELKLHKSQHIGIEDITKAKQITKT